MHWEFIVALIIAIPVIVFPAAVVWYFNVGGMFTALKKAFYQKTRKGQPFDDPNETDRQIIPVREDEFDGEY